MRRMRRKKPQTQGRNNPFNFPGLEGIANQSGRSIENTSKNNEETSNSMLNLLGDGDEMDEADETEQRNLQEDQHWRIEQQSYFIQILGQQLLWPTKLSTLVYYSQSLHYHTLGHAPQATSIYSTTDASIQILQIQYNISGTCQEGSNPRAQSLPSTREAFRSQVSLQEDLTDIFMDLGPMTRELAPLKYKRKHGEKLKSKTLLRVKGLPSVGEHEIDLDQYLFGHHYFHHLVGLSSLRKVLYPIAQDLNFHDLSPGEEDNTFLKDQSYENNNFSKDYKKRTPKNPQQTLSLTAGTISTGNRATGGMTNRVGQNPSQNQFRLGSLESRESKDIDNDTGGWEVSPQKSAQQPVNQRKQSFMVGGFSEAQRANEMNIVDDGRQEADMKAGPAGKNDKFAARRQQFGNFLNKRLNNNQSPPGQQPTQQIIEPPKQSPVIEITPSKRVQQAQKVETPTDKVAASQEMLKRITGSKSEFLDQLMEAAKSEEAKYIQLLDQEYIAQVEQTIDDIEKIIEMKNKQALMKNVSQKGAANVWSEIQKRIDTLITDLHRLFTRNQDKIVPLKTLVRCIQLIPNQEDNKRKDATEQEIYVNEQMQVKLMTLILREFRKNREYTKYRDQRRFAETQAKDKLLSYEKPQQTSHVVKQAISKAAKTAWGARPTNQGKPKMPQPKQGSQSKLGTGKQMANKTGQRQMQRDQDDEWIMMD